MRLFAAHGHQIRYFARLIGLRFPILALRSSGLTLGTGAHDSEEMLDGFAATA